VESVQDGNGISMTNNGVFESASDIRENIPVYSKLIGISEISNTENIENGEKKHDLGIAVVTRNTEKSADEKKLEIINEKLRSEKRKEQEVIKQNEDTFSTALKEEEEQERNEEEKEEVSRKGGRGTFSVGCLPKPLNSPKGNKLFPGRIMLLLSYLIFFYFIYTVSTDHVHFHRFSFIISFSTPAELMEACFALERAICPHRLPSSTIAINRHAQFRPHR
jgi:hypothetical protein